MKKEEWIDMHGKLKEVSKVIFVKKAGQRVAGLGNVAWRRTSEGILLLSQS